MPSSTQVAQAVGITTSAFLAGIPYIRRHRRTLLISILGAVTCISVLSVPSLMLAPSPLVARQWKKLYGRGARTAPSLALTSASMFGFLSYKFYGTLNHPKAELYGLSALLTVGIVPYTLIAMVPTNKKLTSRAETSEALSAEELFSQAGDSTAQSTKELLDLWATHNLARGLFPLAGSILGLWTTLTSWSAR